MLLDRTLLARAVAAYIMGLLFVSLLVFVPAGRLDFWQGWLLTGVLFLPMLVAGIALYVLAPDLLRRRLESREDDADQQAIIALSGLVFLASFVTAGLDARFGWYELPAQVSVVFAIVFLVGYGLYFEVMRENSYLKRTISVERGQTLIQDGLYAHIRHPMYLATLIMFESIPWILGSVVSALIMALYLPLIIWRIRSEEHFLRARLKGYAAYCERVRYRLIPLIW